MDAKMGTESGLIKIAVDAMGGDFAPESIVKGAVLAAQMHKTNIILVGDEPRVKEELRKNDGLNLPIEIYHAPEVLEMGEKPYNLIRRKKRSSLRLAFELVSQNEAQAVVSAGNSGAVVYGALFLLKRLKHIDRPGIATMMPTKRRPVMVIDAGANTFCRPLNLAQFAIMGSIYYREVFGLHSPRVGILSNGEEETKGTDLTRHADELLKRTSLNYLGYVEGGDVFGGEVDIVVCDGFVGNVLLKVAEGVAEAISTTLKTVIQESVISRIGALLSRNAFSSFKRRFDYAEYGGAPLLGVDGTVIIAHGKSNPAAMMNAIRVARNCVEKDLTRRLVEALQDSPDLQSLKRRRTLLDRIFHHGSSPENEENELL